MIDQLPLSVRFVSASTSQGVCAFAAPRSVRCDLRALIIGGNVDVTVVARPTRRGTMTNHAVVRANPFDPNAANNRAVTHTRVN